MVSRELPCICSLVSNGLLQWNLFIMITFGPDILGHFLLQCKCFPLSEVYNVLVTPVGTKIFVLIMGIVYLIQRFHCSVLITLLWLVGKPN